MLLLSPILIILLSATASGLRSTHSNIFGHVRAILAIGTLLTASRVSTVSGAMEFDPEYPGTAVTRLRSVHERVKTLTSAQLNSDWDSVRRSILWAGGLKDLPNSAPGQGYTGHSFNDFNHCDLTTMLDSHHNNENEGRVKGIAQRNPLGKGIRIASIEELGPGGSWSTCMIGCNQEPPQDVAHIQFNSRIAFKLVWVPSAFTSFVLVDDGGNLLAQGTPHGSSLPPLQERKQNYRVVEGSKYATAADAWAREKERELK